VCGAIRVGLTDPEGNLSVSSIRLWLAAILLLSGAPLLAAPPAPTEARPGLPLSIGQRTVHVFRVPLGMFSPQERVDGARKRIELAIEQPGEGWTSARPTEQGIQIELDSKPLFLVLPGDANTLAGETPEDLANQATRVLQKVWSEARERRDPRAAIDALLRVALATVLLVLALVAMVKLQARLRQALSGHVSKRVEGLAPALFGRWLERLPVLAGRALTLCFWTLGMAVAYAYLNFSLSQFVLTRPAAERLSSSLGATGGDAMMAVAASLPGIFVAMIIFLLAWVATRIANEFFAGVETRPIASAKLNAHTAPTTRRIVNTLLWLFAVAMAYPYLPGSHTEAFKGLSVVVGLMASIGASGIVGQIASGVMIVYTYALTKGEYVRIQEYEGIVSEIGLFETRLRTGLGEEISLPNAYVLGNVIRNFSRVDDGNVSVIETGVTIGYDTPWRQVHAMLLEAGATVAEVRRDPPARIVQRALSDFYVDYTLVVYVDAQVQAVRARILSDLNAAILDCFNRYGVQIMSPHYQRDPETPKLVPEAAWYPPPARPPE
jgi:small-conductance mechanosensitive channel